MIGIISALNAELMEIVENLETEKVIYKNLIFYKAKIYNKDVVLGICGVGKVNAAMYTQAMIDYFNPKVIINIGVAGSTCKDVKIGNLVIGTQYFYHDFDCTQAGSYTLGEMPGLKDVKFISDENLVNIAYEKAKKVLKEDEIFKGIIATGDVFVAKKETKDFIKEKFNSFCCEMESCAIVHVCHLNNVKYLALRSISDNANEDADCDFETFLIKASKVVKSIILDIIKEI
ncbi:MTA/SAH nucleosidase [Tissierellia bacterium KA00581]|jgi:hypothetical protein|nr:MTA/SAH nucleosidase [Tissierellia bacterium KA00581]